MRPGCKGELQCQRLLTVCEIVFPTAARKLALRSPPGLIGLGDAPTCGSATPLASAFLSGAVVVSPFTLDVAGADVVTEFIFSLRPASPWAVVMTSLTIAVAVAVMASLDAFRGSAGSGCWFPWLALPATVLAFSACVMPRPLGSPSKSSTDTSGASYPRCLAIEVLTRLSYVPVQREGDKQKTALLQELLTR